MKYLLILIIRVYQVTLSPILKILFGDGCRYLPYCSDYACHAISKYGILKGGWIALKRISRCHPLSNNFSIFDPLK